jgi:hypothetical protein
MRQRFGAKFGKRCLPWKDYDGESRKLTAGERRIHIIESA